MAGVTYKMDGLKQFQDALGAIPKALLAPISRVNRETALAVLARAREGAPKDQGDLQRAISAQGSANGLNWKVGVLDVSIPSRGGNTAHQHPSVYGVWFEYGFVHRKIAAHPFMRPAAQAEEPRYQERINSIPAQLEQAVGKVL